MRRNPERVSELEKILIDYREQCRVVYLSHDKRNALSYVRARVVAIDRIFAVMKRTPKTAP